MWYVLLALLAIVGISIFLTVQIKVPAGVTPLVAICCTSLWFAIVGVLGILWVGGIVWYVLCLVALLFTFIKSGFKNSIQAVFTPAFSLFVLAGIACIVYLGIRQPMLHEWDEYSLWGVIVKLMKENNQLYTTVPNGFAWATTQTPTLPVLAYFVQLFGSYAAWKIYAAYSLLLLSIVATLISILPFKKYQVVVPLGIIGLLVPWFLTVYTREYETKFVWLSSYGDLPAGMLFGGALVLYFVLRKQKASLWPVMPVLVALALVKDNTFVFALAAAGVMVLDLLFIKDTNLLANGLQKNKLAEDEEKKTFLQSLYSLFGKKGSYTLLGRLAFSALYFISAFLPYLLWGRHVASVVVARQSQGLADPTSQSPTSALVIGTKMLLGLTPRTDWFNENFSAMWDAFFWNIREDGSKLPGGAALGMLGGGLIIVMVITAIFFVSILLASNKKTRIRMIISYIAMLVCFVGYSYEIFISYVFIFDESQGLLPSYNRYMYGYYIGWFLLAVFFLGQVATDYLGDKQLFTGKLKPLLAQGGILALAGIMLLRTTMLLPLGNSDVGYAQATFNTQKIEQNFADVIVEKLGDSTQRVFFVSQNDNGEKWFLYHYMLVPHILDYSGVPQKVGGAGGGGGTYTSPDLLNGEPATDYNTYSPEELQAYLTETGCTYMLIEALDDRFVASYAALFTDGLEQAKEGNTVLYKVEGTDKELQLTPVEMEVPVR